MTSAQIDRLGQRLKTDELTEADLRALDDYRQSFASAYAVVLEVIRERLGLQPTGRIAKSTASVVDKLRRESIRLSQMQDIAGCRLVVPDIESQNRIGELLRTNFEHVTVVDRRGRPSHGYRAVHLIVRCNGKLVEIQVRTEAQHLWAEISEKLADRFDPALKYGAGPAEPRDELAALSRLIANEEGAEDALAVVSKVATVSPLPDEVRKNVEEAQELLSKQRDKLHTSMQNFLTSLPVLLGGEDSK